MLKEKEQYEKYSITVSIGIHNFINLLLDIPDILVCT